jgi:hypothetical protein
MERLQSYFQQKAANIREKFAFRLARGRAKALETVGGELRQRLLYNGRRLWPIDGAMDFKQSKKDRAVEIKKGAPGVRIALFALLPDFMKGEECRLAILHEAISRGSRPTNAV